MITRRRIVLGGLAVFGVAALAAAGLGPAVAESQIASHVRRRLSFLHLDAAGVNAFAHDQVAFLLAKRPTWNRMKYHFLTVFSQSFTRYERSTDRRTRAER